MTRTFLDEKQAQLVELERQVGEETVLFSTRALDSVLSAGVNVVFRLC